MYQVQIREAWKLRVEDSSRIELKLIELSLYTHLGIFPDNLMIVNPFNFEPPVIMTGRLNQREVNQLYLRLYHGEICC